VTEPAYSPRLRTGVVLCGGGTAGAYQAGVLRALSEAGVKVDVFAAHGAGVVNALCAAVDGGAAVWSDASPWLSPRLTRAYRWRPALRVAAAGLLGAAALVLAPLGILVVAGGAYTLGVLAALASLESASAALMAAYARLFEWLFSPPIMPTIMPRAVVLALLVVLAVLAAAAWRAARTERTRRRFRGAFWARLFGAPIDAREPAATAVDALWHLVRGASGAPRPEPADIGRRFVELLTDNFGQPGFSEVLIAVHDLDARRDLVAAVLTGDHRAAFLRHQRPGGPREAEALDLSGPSRALLVDLMAAAMRQPVAQEAAALTFPADGYWLGETHRLCDRPDLPVRLIDELAQLGVEQVILVSAAEPPSVPHGMRVKDADLRARIGEAVRSVETAALAEAIAQAASRAAGVFVIRPGHNPLMPFSFGGAYDEASDRRRTVAELRDLGHRDAYRQFLEPVVAAGERIERGEALST
jgi:hypothetical protein